jgi:hypothetical protein
VIACCAMANESDDARGHARGYCLAAILTKLRPSWGPLFALIVCGGCAAFVSPPIAARVEGGPAASFRVDQPKLDSLPNVKPAAGRKGSLRISIGAHPVRVRKTEISAGYLLASINVGKRTVPLQGLYASARLNLVPRSKKYPLPNVLETSVEALYDKDERIRGAGLRVRLERLSTSNYRRTYARCSKMGHPKMCGAYAGIGNWRAGWFMSFGYSHLSAFSTLDVSVGLLVQLPLAAGAAITREK